jgi:hypothetical protein
VRIVEAASLENSSITDSDASVGDETKSSQNTESNGGLSLKN